MNDGLLLGFGVATYTVQLLVGALQTLLGPLGLYQILQTFIKTGRLGRGEAGAEGRETGETCAAADTE